MTLRWRYSIPCGRGGQRSAPSFYLLEIAAQLVGDHDRRITGASFSPSMAAASTRPFLVISFPPSATIQGTVQPNFAMLAAIFAT